MAKGFQKASEAVGDFETDELGKVKGAKINPSAGSSSSAGRIILSKEKVEKTKVSPGSKLRVGSGFSTIEATPPPPPPPPPSAARSGIRTESDTLFSVDGGTPSYGGTPPHGDTPYADGTSYSGTPPYGDTPYAGGTSYGGTPPHGDTPYADGTSYGGTPPYGDTPYAGGTSYAGTSYADAAPSYGAPYAPPKKRRKIVPIIISSVAAVLLLAFAACYIFNVFYMRYNINLFIGIPNKPDSLLVHAKECTLVEYTEPMFNTRCSIPQEFDEYSLSDFYSDDHTSTIAYEAGNSALVYSVMLKGDFDSETSDDIGFSDSSSIQPYSHYGNMSRFMSAVFKDTTAYAKELAADEGSDVIVTKSTDYELSMTDGNETVEMKMIPVKKNDVVVYETEDNVTQITRYIDDGTYVKSLTYSNSDNSADRHASEAEYAIKQFK